MFEHDAMIGDPASLVQVVGDHEHRGAEFAVHAPAGTDAARNRTRYWVDEPVLGGSKCAVDHVVMIIADGEGSVPDRGT